MALGPPVQLNRLKPIIRDRVTSDEDIFVALQPDETVGGDGLSLVGIIITKRVVSGPRKDAVAIADIFLDDDVHGPAKNIHVATPTYCVGSVVCACVGGVVKGVGGIPS